MKILIHDKNNRVKKVKFSMPNNRGMEETANRIHDRIFTMFGEDRPLIEWEYFHPLNDNSTRIHFQFEYYDYGGNLRDELLARDNKLCEIVDTIIHAEAGEMIL